MLARLDADVGRAAVQAGGRPWGAQVASWGGSKGPREGTGGDVQVK